MKYRVSVTNRHIKAGVFGSCSLCPVALALREALPDYAFAVGWGSFTVCVPGEELGENIARIETPLLARRFIKKFDSLNAVRPFSFYVEV